MRPASPRAVAELVTAAVPELGERLLEDRIRREWTTLMGEEVARRAHPKRLSNGCLEIAVDNSPWLHELTLRSPELTERLAARVAGVRALRLVLGSVPAPAATPTTVPERLARPLSADETRAVEDAVAGIAEPTARAAARRLLRTALGAAVPGASAR